LIKMVPAEKPKIPDALVQATIESMRAGIRLDEKVLEAQAAKEAAMEKNKGKKRDERRRPQLLTANESEDELIERTYRAHEDRRFGFLIIGDQHRFGGKQVAAEINSAPPLDYSFCLLNTVDEIVTEQEIPQTRRNYKVCEKTEDDRYITASLRLSYNVLHNFDGFVNVLYKILDAGPFGLCWLDLSFNSIDKLDDDTFSQLPNLKILYLHGNSLADMTEIPKLKTLTSLLSLTLHGNPIEQEDAYRICILYHLPYLKHLDFIGVTKGDLATSGRFGSQYEPLWAKKHLEIEARAKLLKETLEMSLTARLLQSKDDYDSDSD